MRLKFFFIPFFILMLMSMCLALTGDMFRSDRSSVRWQQLPAPPTKLTDLPASLGTTVYGMGNDGQLYRYKEDQSTWQPISELPYIPKYPQTQVTKPCTLDHPAFKSWSKSKDSVLTCIEIYEQYPDGHIDHVNVLTTDGQVWQATESRSAYDRMPSSVILAIGTLIGFMLGILVWSIVRIRDQRAERR